MSLGRIVVLYNQLTDRPSKDDLDILPQVEAVSHTLDQMGYGVRSLTFSMDGLPADLSHSATDLVFNLVETVSSENKWAYIAPALLEARGIPHTGCTAASILMTTDKIATKAMLRHTGIPTPDWVSPADWAQFAPGNAYIIKARFEDASIGLCGEPVRSFDDAVEVLEYLRCMRAKSGREFFAERYIDGREFSISILGENGKPRTLAPSELLFPGYDERNMAKVLDYSAKWEPASFGYQTIFSVCRFGRKDSALLRKMQAISEKCWSLFGLRGYARVDFRVDKQGEPWVLEVNTNPCMTPGESGFLNSATESGLIFEDVVDRIVKEALGRDSQLATRQKRRVVS